MTYVPRFTRKYTDDQVRESVRLVRVEGLTYRAASTVTGIPKSVIESYAKGRRRAAKRTTVRDHYRGLQGEELRLYFIDKASRLLSVYQRIAARFEETGKFEEPDPEEFDVRSVAKDARTNAPRSFPKPVAVGPGAGGEGAGAGIAEEPGVASERQPVRPADRNPGQGRPPASGWLFDRQGGA